MATQSHQHVKFARFRGIGVDKRHQQQALCRQQVFGIVGLSLVGTIMRFCPTAQQLDGLGFFECLLYVLCARERVWMYSCASKHAHANTIEPDLSAATRAS